jgi:hypothetical protein
VSRGTWRPGSKGRDEDLLADMRWRIGKLDSYADRVRRSSREIIIASALTLAALAFLLAALWGGAAVTGKSKVGNVASEEDTIK